MYTNTQKLNLIEGLLKTNDEKLLHEFELLLQKKPASTRKKILASFIGVWSANEANSIRKAIHETCEQIHESDWE